MVFTSLVERSAACENIYASGLKDLHETRDAVSEFEGVCGKVKIKRWIRVLNWGGEPSNE